MGRDSGYYLGLDASTQSLTGLVIEVSPSVRRVVHQHSLNFDQTFPEFGTTHGVLPHPDPLVAHSPPLLWVAALDRFLHRLARELGDDRARLRAISGAGQQHGSVYLNARAEGTLPALRPDLPLPGQVAPCLARPVAPIWMDGSTSTECRVIGEASGGAENVARVTGSEPVERFTGPQIRKFWQDDPVGYQATDRIHLVSSFLASLLIGGHAPLEPGDAAGMNLMDIRTRDWAPLMLDATAPDLRRRLSEIVPSSTVIGTLGRYWRERYGFPAASVVAWTGDNPSSLVGTGLVDSRRLGISLGTSDTAFRIVEGPCTPPSGSHVFGAPTGGYMGLTCWQNGGLARERVRDAYGLDWDGFADALRATPPGNSGRTMLPWFAPEITPRVAHPEVRRYDLAPDDVPGNVRAVVEAQLLAMARHGAWMWGEAPEALHAMGGGAAMPEILQVMADVFDRPVYRINAGPGAALGGALRALHGTAPSKADWHEVIRGLADPPAESMARPVPEAVAIYRRLATIQARREADAMVC